MFELSVDTIMINLANEDFAICLMFDNKARQLVKVCWSVIAVLHDAGKSSNAQEHVFAKG